MGQARKVNGNGGEGWGLGLCFTEDVEEEFGGDRNKPKVKN